MMSHNVEKATSGGVATKTMTQSDYGKMGGRPAVWQDPQEFETAIERYKIQCDEKNEPFLLSGLACELGVSRRALLDYSKKDAFLPSIQKARHYAEFSTEKVLMSGRAQVGAIFSLKNNFGWVDAKQLDVNQSITISSVFNQLTGAPIDAIEGQTVDESELLLE